jgi:hypothetical protein
VKEGVTRRKLRRNVDCNWHVSIQSLLRIQYWTRKHTRHDRLLLELMVDPHWPPINEYINGLHEFKSVLQKSFFGSNIRVKIETVIILSSSKIKTYLSWWRDTLTSFLSLLFNWLMLYIDSAIQWTTTFFQVLACG